jgi:hypothetical protein
MTTTIDTGDRREQIAAPVATRARRRWPLAVGVFALLGIGGASWASGADAGSGQIERVDLRSPAVLREAHARGQIAEWAAANHLAGLSPASLQSVADTDATLTGFGPR